MAIEFRPPGLEKAVDNMNARHNRDDIGFRGIKWPEQGLYTNAFRTTQKYKHPNLPRGRAAEVEFEIPIGDNLRAELESSDPEVVDAANAQVQQMMDMYIRANRAASGALPFS